jgi:N-acetylglucosamine kinase-like BadF-type ATPase
MNDYFLGVDGGQSSTTAVIADEAGKVCGWATAGPCNHVAASESRAKFLRVMRECISQAADRAGLEAGHPRFRGACLGMSGGPDDKAGLLHEVFASDHLLVTHDGQIALAGATGGAPGIIVIAGTGTFSFGENARSETARAGGWGYVFGDEGGGFDIVRQALRATLAEHEGWGPRTALTPALLEATSTSNANQTLHLFYTPDWPRSRVAALARVVDDIAQQGDPVALEILQRAAMQLAMLAGTVRRQLWNSREAQQHAVKLAWIGGVFNSTTVLERFRMLVELEDNLTAAPPAHSPAIGAVMLACKLAGVTVLPDPLPMSKS